MSSKLVNWFFQQNSILRGQVTWFSNLQILECNPFMYYERVSIKRVNHRITTYQTISRFSFMDYQLKKKGKKREAAYKLKYMKTQKDCYSGALMSMRREMLYIHTHTSGKDKIQLHNELKQSSFEIVVLCLQWLLSHLHIKRFS